MLLLLPALVIAVMVSAGLHTSADQPASVAPAAAFDPRLILQPRTVTQTVSLAGLRLTLVASPLLPGTNRLLLQLAEHGRAVSGVRLRVAAKILGMIMTPLRFTAREDGNGRYEASGPLAMFGPWRVTIAVKRPGSPMLSHDSVLDLEIPPALLESVPPSVPAATPASPG